MATGETLRDANKIPLIAQVMTDYCELDEHVVPSEQHIQSKAETVTVQGAKSVFCHFLARFRRKTICESTSEFLLGYYVMLLMAQWNGELLSNLDE